MKYDVRKIDRNITTGTMILAVLLLTACGGGGGGSAPPATPPPAVVSLTVPSTTALVPPGKNKTFSATVTGSSNTAVTWVVVEGSSGGSITGGVYTAPATPGTYHLTATSVADNTKTTTITVTVPEYPRFVYTGNSGDGTISVDAIDYTTGHLRSNGFYDVGTSMAPSAMAINPTGTFLFVAEYNNSYVFTLQIQQPGNLNLAGKLVKNVGQVPSAGNPAAVAADPSGKYLYVANFNGGVTGFLVDSITGALTTGIPGGNLFSAGTNPDGIVIDPSGKFVYVSNMGGGVSAYSIDNSSGSLTSIAGSFPTGVNPMALAIDSAGKHLYVANNDGTLSSFAVLGNGALQSIANVPVGTSLNSVTIDPSGNFIYVTDGVTNQVYGYLINRATGALTSITGSPFATGPTPQSVSVDSSGQFLYVANAGTRDTWEYSINQSGGVLTKTGIKRLRGRSGSYSMAQTKGDHPISYSPKFAFAANYSSSNVFAYSINSTTGQLSNVGAPNTISAGTTPNAMAVDPTGSFLYVTDSTNATVLAYIIDPITGVLNAISGSPFSTDLAPQSLTIDPSGRYLYVANQSSNSITIFGINTDGTLGTPVSQPIGVAPQSVSIDCTGQLLYVGYSSSGPSDVNVYQIDSHSGGITLVSGSPFGGSGANPYSIATDPTGQFVYVIDQVLLSNNVAGFAVSSDSNLTSGQQGSLVALSQPLVTSGDTPTMGRIDPSGRFLFVTNSGSTSSNVASFTIDSLTGNLGLSGYSNPNFAISQPYDLNIDFSGRFAYVADAGTGYISTYSIDPVNGLANLNPVASIPAGTSPRAIVTTGVVQ
jgi:6-phosphogluconolactonase